MARERRVEIRLVNRHPAVASYAHWRLRPSLQSRSCPMA
jgi:hypothetical protein